MGTRARCWDGEGSGNRAYSIDLCHPNPSPNAQLRNVSNIATDIFGPSRKWHCIPCIQHSPSLSPNRERCGEVRSQGDLHPLHHCSDHQSSEKVNQTHTSPRIFSCVTLSSFAERDIVESSLTEDPTRARQGRTYPALELSLELAPFTLAGGAPQPPLRPACHPR